MLRPSEQQEIKSIEDMLPKDQKNNEIKKELNQNNRTTN